MSQVTKVSIPAQGAVLAGVLYQPAGPSSLSPILIAPATGITQRFYHGFATWLMEQGHTVLTFDNRGIGASLNARHVRESKAKKQDWGLYDMPAALNFLLTHTGAQKAWMIGHSAGGQLLGLMNNHHRIERALAVAASSGYVRRLRWPGRLSAWFMLKVMIPLSARTLGYVPSKKFGWGENLPKDVGLQWAKWCSSPGYVENEFGDGVKEHFYAQLSTPVVYLYASDDPIATPSNVRDIMRLAPQAPARMLEIKPDEFEVPAIGHVDMFRTSHRAIWPLMLAQLRQAW
ncbi:MAG TPA: alpha/beta fold hydrolase [Limnobacter sp.]|nr:alpha/beta fold hydrolase [Limnobacter sp.]